MQVWRDEERVLHAGDAEGRQAGQPRLLARHPRARSTAPTQEGGRPQQAEGLGRAQQLALQHAHSPESQQHGAALPAEWRGAQPVHAERPLEAVDAEAPAVRPRRQSLAQSLACDATAQRRLHEDGRQLAGHTSQVQPPVGSEQQERYTDQGMSEVLRCTAVRMVCIEQLQRYAS